MLGHISQFEILRLVVARDICRHQVVVDILADLTGDIYDILDNVLDQLEIHPADLVDFRVVDYLDDTYDSSLVVLD